MGNSTSSPAAEENPWASIARNSTTVPTAATATSPKLAETIAIKLPASINYNSLIPGKPLSFEFEILQPDTTLSITTNNNNAAKPVYLQNYAIPGKHTFNNDNNIASDHGRQGDFTIRFFSTNAPARLVVTVDENFALKSKQAVINNNNQVVQLEEIFGLASQHECVVCLTEMSTTLFEPCRHMCVCLDCSQQLQQSKCPICRLPIDNMVQVKRRV